MSIQLLGRRFVLFACTVVLLLGTERVASGGPVGARAPAEAPAGAKADAKQEELRRVQQRLEHERNRLTRTRWRERRLSAEIRRLDGQRELSEARLARLTMDLGRTRMRAEAAAGALARAEIALAHRRTVLAARLRDLHRHGRAGYLDVVLGAASFPEFVSRARLVSAVVRADARLIQTYTTDRDRVAALRDDLQREQARLHALIRETDQRRRQLAAETAAKREALDAIVRERAAAEGAVRELEEDSAELEALIRQLQTGRASAVPWSMAAIQWPLRGAITSRFGFRRHPVFRLRQFHQGVDIAAPRGAPVRAAFDGVVLFAGWFGGYGKLIVIDHGDGISTLYGHLSAIDVAAGQGVVRGQVIGRVGSTGYSTGPHLHFEIRRNGRPVNPSP